MQAFVPRGRRPKFRLRLKIFDLNNVPLVSGTSVVKWFLPHSASAEHRGRTGKCNIKDHKVTYDYEKEVTVRLTVDKNSMLQESVIHFEVVQEYAGGARAERIVLGNIKLNLAEYVEASEAEEEEEVVRRYLMQDSKINSTLKIGIGMVLVEGDRNFIAPPLKTAATFGGIAGIMAGEQQEPDDVGHMPSLLNKSTETGEAQDMYRRTLAAYLTAQPGELRADECVEDIFSGGDGWGNRDEQQDQSPRKWRFSREGDRSSWGNDYLKAEDTRGRSRSRDHDKASDNSPRQQEQKSKGYSNVISGGVGGRGSLEQQANTMKQEAASRKGRSTYDIDELEIREDLKSWSLPGKVL